MTNDGPQERKTLLEWEAFLVPQLRQVELLGEISLTFEETQQLGQQFGHFIAARRHRGLLETREAIEKTCPCALAVLLVAQGVHDSNAENGFWPDLDDTLGQELDARWRRELGLLFEEILEANRLPLFPDLLEGYRFVSRILLHGGIPNYSLDDYFRYLLRPAMLRRDYVALSSVELIDEWLHHASGRYFSDKPVLRFLEFGGQVAIDFVERTRELAREFLETGLIPPAEQIGLPERVVEGFHEWAVERKGLGEDPPPPPPGLRLRRPKVRLDPWGEGISLDLLPQQIPATFSHARIEWEVKLDGQIETTLPLRLQRVGYNLQTPFESLVLERAVDSCEASLLLDNEARRTSTFPLGGPMLVFDPTNHTLLRWKNSLPARPLWLLYSQDASLEFSGPAAKLEEFPPLPWGWDVYKGEAWDLSQATNLTLRQREQSLLELPIRTDEEEKRPHLGGGQRHRTFTLIKTPLYIGAPPYIRIPLVGRTHPDEEMSRWRLTLYNSWPAAPGVNLRRIALSELPQRLTQKEKYADLSLGSPTLLGATPMGNYTIRIRGPLGRDAELPLRLIPYLEVTGHEQLYLPDPQNGPPEIELLVETEPGMVLEAQAEDNPCQVQRMRGMGEHWLYQVTVGPELTEARLAAVMAQPGGEAVRVPLHVPLRRVRWTLTGDTAGVDSQRLQWTGHMITQSLDALEQTVSPVLFVDLGPSVETDDLAQMILKLYLVDLEGREWEPLPLSRPLRDPDSVVFRFELSAFLDTIRHDPYPIMRFELEYKGEEGSVRLPVLNVTRSMHVEQVRVNIQEVEAATVIILKWHEPARLRHRRVRFWPLWQPWHPYREEIISDEAEGELSFSVIGPDFLVGKYLLEFLVVDPWTATTPTSINPPATGPNLAVLELSPPEVRLEQIERGIQTVGPGFALYLEHAYIEADLQQFETVLVDLWQCYQWFDQASLPQILAMAALVQQTDDERLLTLLRLKMSKSERIRQLLQEYNLGTLSQAQMDAYRDQILHRISPWPMEFCEPLLEFPYEPVQIFALMHLIRQGARSGGTTILERITDHRLSDIDGADLFEINVDFATEFLANHLADPKARRLLMRLTERDPERNWPILIVRPGHFVRSCAGWGRIDRIEEISSSQILEHFLSNETGFRLGTTLRPNHDMVPVALEVLDDRQRLLFQPDMKLYRCVRDKHCTFATPNENLLYHGHNRVAHEGIGAKHERMSSPMVSIQSPEYRIRAPHNILE